MRRKTAHEPRANHFPVRENSTVMKRSPSIIRARTGPCLTRSLEIRC
jgi:hypothetical protein